MFGFTIGMARLALFHDYGHVFGHDTISISSSSIEFYKSQLISIDFYPHGHQYGFGHDFGHDFGYDSHVFGHFSGLRNGAIRNGDLRIDARSRF